MHGLSADSAELEAEVRRLSHPKVARIPFREFDIEICIILLACAPREKVEHAHGAERFDETKRPFIETAEEAVAFQEGVDERTALAWFVRQQHPEVLYRRADDHVVEINQKEPFVGAVQDVEIVAVTVDADKLRIVWK